MIGLTLHTLESAPAESIGILTEAKRKFGMIPNLLGILAEAPSALKAYLSIAEIFEQSSLNPTEQQVVLLTTSVLKTGVPTAWLPIPPSQKCRRCPTRFWSPFETASLLRIQGWRRSEN